ncbi:MAG: TetR-like C-terminal domain-containing protein [Actinomycetota bacterium]|nr:TetR-like C-terminal domain-containing protein [Actinomycetota bacterium]
MAARRGVTAEQVVEAALSLLDEAGRLDAVRPASVAGRLGIRSQSLYAHVDGVDGLRRLLALRCLSDLSEVVTMAAVGRSGRDAVEAIVRAQLDFALVHPGRSEATLHPPGDDPDLAVAIDRAGGPLRTVLASLGLDDEARVHWVRLQLALTAGYSSLVRDGRLTLSPEPSTTVDHLVAAMLDQLPDLSSGQPPIGQEIARI